MKNDRGFVLIEMVVVFGMLAVLTIMTVINVFGSKRTATLEGAVTTFIADAKSQQARAMNSAQVSGVTPSGYGIYVDESGYTLFRGTVYNASDTTNSRVPLDTRLRFSEISLPSATLAFVIRSGEFFGYDGNTNSVTIENIDSHATKTIRFNMYGVVSSVD